MQELVLDIDMWKKLNLTPYSGETFSQKNTPKDVASWIPWTSNSSTPFYFSDCLFPWFKKSSWLVQHFVHWRQDTTMPKCYHMFDGHEKKGHKNVAPSFFHSLRLRKWEESPKNKGLWNIYIWKMYKNREEMRQENVSWNKSMEKKN